MCLIASQQLEHINGSILLDKHKHSTSEHHGALPQQSIQLPHVQSHRCFAYVSCHQHVVTGIRAICFMTLHLMRVQQHNLMQMSKHAAVCYCVGAEDHAVICGVQEGRPTCQSGMHTLTATTIQGDYW